MISKTLHYWNHYFEKEEKMSIVLSFVFHGIMFNNYLNPTLLPVLCRCFKPCDTSLHLSWSDLTVMQIITPCVATKLKVCYLLQMLFFVTFNSLLAKNVLVILINCYFTSACTWHFLFYGRTFLQSNWENCEHQKYFWNVIVLQDKSQLGMRN